jgi:hypothetical protein|tara:strand:+ start:1528 stop:1734 length:207 start_codon:yes stop_codon:yes gene_type:complete
MQSKKLEELRAVLPLNEDDKEVLLVAAELIRTLREDVAALQNEIDAMGQVNLEPSPVPVAKKRRRWLF